MIGPDLRSSAFQVLSALQCLRIEVRGATWPQLLRLSTTSDHRPLHTQAFHNQRPQAIAATGFPQPAATGHCSHRPDLYVQFRSGGSHLGSRQLARNLIGLWSGILGLHRTAHGKTVSDCVQLPLFSRSHSSYAKQRGVALNIRFGL